MNLYPYFERIVEGWALVHLARFERDVMSLNQGDTISFHPGEKVPIFYALKLVHKVKQQRLQNHVDIRHFDRLLSDKAPQEEQLAFLFHLFYCKACFDEARKYKLTYYRHIQQNFFSTLENENFAPTLQTSMPAQASIPVQEQDDESDEDDENDESDESNENTAAQDISPQADSTTNESFTVTSQPYPSDQSKPVFEIESLANIQTNPTTNETSSIPQPNDDNSSKTSDQIPATEDSTSQQPNKVEDTSSTAQPKGVNHYMKIAAAVILCLKLSAFSFYGGYRYQKAEVVKEVQSTRSANTETDAVKLAKIFEDASKRIESNSNDSVAYLIRATAAKKLMLLDQAVEDYKAYCALTDSSCERELEIIEKIKSLKVEKTSYDLIDENIDQYLTSLMKYDNAAAQSYLAEAKVLADAMLKKTGDRLGVDLVSYYRNLSVEKAGILLEARKIRSQIDKTPALDNFSEYIPKLEKVKATFKQNSATVEAAYNATVLSRFYLKAFKHDESKKEVDEFLKLSTDAGYKICEAGLLLISGQIAFTKNNIANLIALNDKSIEVYSQIEAGTTSLAPFMIGVNYHIDITENTSLAFSNGLEGLKKSLKKEEENKRLAAFAARFARFQAIAAHKMNMPQLAEHYIRQAIAICDEYEISLYRTEYYCLLAVLRASNGKKDEALKMIKTAKTYMPKDSTGQKNGLLTIVGYTGKVYGLLKDYSLSETSYKEALQLAQELGTTELIYTAELKKGLGEALCMQGRKPEAKIELAESKEMYDKARAVYQAMKAPLIKPSFTEKSVEELLVLVETR